MYIVMGAGNYGYGSYRYVWFQTFISVYGVTMYHMYATKVSYKTKQQMMDNILNEKKNRNYVG